VKRSDWTALTDEQLLAQCEVDTYRASGPGGQKRNKTSSAVRLRHEPSGLSVIAEESRSQHENRARALRRMRQALYLWHREAIDPAQLAPGALAQRPEVVAGRGRDGRLHVGARDLRFWPIAGLLLDVLFACHGHVRETAAALGISTGNLVDFLRTDKNVWTKANVIRTQFALPLLR
jgi:hypothetical protein